MKRAFALAAAAALVASCRLAEQEENAALGARNTCKVSDDCGTEGSCDRGRCVSTSYVAPDDLVFEITPSAVAGAAAGFVPGLPYAIHSAEQACSTSGGVCLPAVTHPTNSFDSVDADGATHPLKLPPLVSTSVTVRLLDESVAAYEGCALPTVAGGALRASITILPDEQARGLPTHTTVGVGPDSAGRVTVSAQTGLYALYVQLLPPLDLGGLSACRVPPLLLRGYASDPHTPEYVVKLPPLERLQGTIAAPPGFTFEGWDVTILDATTGLPLSNAGTVGPLVGSTNPFGGVDPATGGLAGAIEFFSPQDATTGKQGNSYVVRIAPPASAPPPRPSFAWTSDVLAIGMGDQVALDLSAYVPSAVTLTSARLEDADSTAGVGGRVQLRSFAKQGITGAPPGRPTGFSTFAETDPAEPGRIFDITLPPGKYEVVGIPDGTSLLGLVRQSWQVGATPAKQGGRVLSAKPAPHTSVRLLALGGAAAPNVPLEAGASAGAVGAFDAVFGMSPVLSRGGSSITSADGSATLSTDPGTFDLTARFPARTGFPWTVRRDVVGGSDLTLAAVLPVVVSGRIGQPDPDPEHDVPIAGGVLRAYALLPASGELPARYVQIGETTIDASGAYELLLPARVGP